VLPNQPSFTLNDSVSTSNFTTSVNPFLNNLDQNLTNSTFTFYGANKPTGTIDIAKVVPDYSAYGKIAQLNYFLNLSNVDRLATQTSISKDSANNELTDLYFKGWQFYTSYEYGPEVVTLDNKVARCRDDEADLVEIRILRACDGNKAKEVGNRAVIVLTLNSLESDVGDLLTSLGELFLLQARQAIRMRVCSTLTSLSPMLIRTPFTS